jgi:hypothetical protein
MIRRVLLGLVALLVTLVAVPACDSGTGTSGNTGPGALVSNCKTYLVKAAQDTGLQITDAAAATRCQCVARWLISNAPTQVSGDTSALDAFNNGTGVDLPVSFTMANTTCDMPPPTDTPTDPTG